MMAEWNQRQGAALPSIEIAGRRWSAAAPLEICRGECQGILEYLAKGDLAGVRLEEALARAAARGDQRIYVCDVASRRLRPLVSQALGFVFREGASLGHLAGELRHRRIPACIDQELWRRGKEAALSVNANLPCRLCCGQELAYSPEAQDRYRLQLESYWRRLVGHRLELPIYDLAGKGVLAEDTPLDPRFGEKALAVNALLAEQLPAPRALVLINPGNRPVLLEEDRSLSNLVDRVFPSFGRIPGYALMVRGSLQTRTASPPSSGLLRSVPVASVSQLTQAVTDLVCGWKRIEAQGDPPGLSIVVQERIEAKVIGVLGTERPWERGAAGAVAELSFDDSDAPAGPRRRTLVTGLEAARRLPGQLSSRLPRSLESAEFSQALARFLDDGLRLRDDYAIPLEIEFAVGGDLQFHFVQFRPLYRS